MAKAQAAKDFWLKELKAQGLKSLIALLRFNNLEVWWDKKKDHHQYNQQQRQYEGSILAIGINAVKLAGLNEGQNQKKK